MTGLIQLSNEQLLKGGTNVHMTLPPEVIYFLKYDWWCKKTVIHYVPMQWSLSETVT